MKCIVKKLAAVVDNAELKKVGEFALYVEIPSKQWIPLVLSYSKVLEGHVRVGSNENVYISSDMTSKVKELNVVSDNNSIYVYNDTNDSLIFPIFATHKVNINRFNGTAGSDSIDGFKIFTKGFRYENAETLPAYHTTIEKSTNHSYLLGDIQDLIGLASKIQSLYVHPMEGGHISTDIFGKFEKLTNLTLDNYVIGDIKELGKLLSLTNLAFGNATNVHGTIESLVAEFRKNGKLSGSFTGNSVNKSKVTFNGSTGKAIKSFAWTENTITVNGETINA